MSTRKKIVVAVAAISTVVYAAEAIRATVAFRARMKEIDAKTAKEIESIKYAEAKVGRMIAEGYYINKSIVDIGYDFELFRMEYHETQ